MTRIAKYAAQASVKLIQEISKSFGINLLGSFV